MVIVGNKVDLEHQREVAMQLAESTVLNDWNNGFVESSAKDNIHVVKIFQELLEQAKIRQVLKTCNVLVTVKTMVFCEFFYYVK